MPDTPMTPERLAELFHESYERLAPEHGYRTREASAVPWSDVPAANKALMIATCAEVLAVLGAEAALSRQAIDTYVSALAVERAEVTRLRPMEATLAAARELHQPYGIYDECGHDHTEEDIKAGRAVFVEGDYYSCADGLMYWACTVCCTWRTKDGELYGQSEDCANGGYGHDHDKTDKPICPTRAALDGGA